MKRVLCHPWVAVALAVGWFGQTGCGMADDAASCETCGDSGPSKLSIAIESSISPEVGERALMSAAVDRDAYRVTGYRWTVSGPDGAALEPVDEGGTRISFALDHGAGTYTVGCRAQVEDGRELEASVSLTATGGADLTYTARIYPPPATGAPPVDWVERVGGGDKTGLLWVVKEGVEVRLEVRRQLDGAGGTAELLPAFIRLTRADQQALPRDIYLDRGEATIRLSGAFDALIIPEGDKVAPAVQTGLDEATVGPHWQVGLDEGLAVRGTVTQGGGAPLDGVVVTLHTIDDQSSLTVPSTVGHSDAGGAFSLLARPGRARLTVTPPEGSAFPLAVVGPGSGLALDGPADGWVFTFKPPQLVQLAGQVTLADGKTPAAAVTLVLRSDAIADVGQLDVAGASFSADGHYRRVLSTDAQGSIVDLEQSGGPVQVPRGSYEVLLLPADGESDAQGRAVRQLLIDDQTALDPPTLALGARVSLSGMVVGFNGMPAPARISARGALETFDSQTDDQGHFALQIDDAQSYTLVIRPLHGTGGETFGPLLLPAVTMAGSKSLDQLVLPRAVTLSGQIKTSGNAALAGALIRIRCSSSDCPGAEVIDEARTAADGSFTLRVPRP